MRGTGKKWLRIAGGLCAYLLLLRLLVFAEAAAPDATITTMADAVWFSLVTLTTAGYGDFYPVTAGGRLVGTLFLLLSTGLLAVLVSGLVLLASGRLIPGLRLFLKRGRPWYIFSSLSQESAAMAQNLLREQPEAAVIFCRKQASAVPGRSGWLLIDAEPGELLSRRGRRMRRTLLIMGEDSPANLALAGACGGFGVPVYCQSDLLPRSVPETLHLFERWECCARLYWQRRPLEQGEETIVFCGFGRCGAALLEQALLVNVFPAPRRAVYHVFGSDGDFCREHYRLADAVSVNRMEPGRDAVFFHPESWDACPELLAGADRVILCEDDDGRQADMLRRIRRWFPVGGKLHMRFSRILEGETVFGADEELFTPELVLRTGLDQAARQMHGIYRRGVGNQAPAWEELSDFLRRSNLAAADHLLTKARVLLEEDGLNALTADVCRGAYRRYLETREARGDCYRETEHRRWARFYILNGWQYGPVRDNVRRRHPDLRPFEQLSPEEMAKDDYAWQLLGILADEMGGAGERGEET